MTAWAIRRLAGHHDRSAFDCGKPPLSDWLRRFAGQHEARDLARVYVLTRTGEPRVFGYYAISNGQIRLEDLPPAHAKGLPRHVAIPGILIGRLAIDLGVAGQGLGSALLADALGRARRLADQVAIRVVTVDALDDEARGFYLHHDFLPLADNPRHLFIAMSALRGLDLPTPADG